MAEPMNALRRTTLELSQQNGREPSIEEICAASDLKRSDAVCLSQLAHPLRSLDQSVTGHATARIGELLYDDRKGEAINDINAEELRRRLVGVLGMLSDREREVIQLRFGLCDGQARTLDEVGKLFEVSRERVRQIEVRAMEKLRAKNSSKRLLGFLDD